MKITRLLIVVMAVGAATASSQPIKLSVVPAVRPLAMPVGPLGIIPGPSRITSPAPSAFLPVPVLPGIQPSLRPGVPVSELARLPVESSRAAGQAVMDRVLVYSIADIKAGASAKSSKKRMPDPEDKPDNGEDLSDLDELGNPRRRTGGDGPDDVSDEFSGGGRGNSDLF